MKLKLLIGSAMALSFASVSAVANIIVVTPVVGNLYQQSVQSPCVFANPSCKNDGFPATDLPNGNVSGWDLLSPSYSGAQITSIIGSGNPLRLGLDINEATGVGPQTLTAFYMLINGSVVDSFTTPMLVPAGNNGNGYGDFLLSNFSPFLAADSVRFRFVFDNANAGLENVFLIGGAPTNVPEPGTLGLLGLALVGLGIFRRNKVTT
jgi:hypothetical protein